jgi:hypothetical protein
MTSYTRVFTEGGTVAHILDFNRSPNDQGATALCGRTPWPGYWFGTGTQDEEERATDMRLCVACQSVLSHRMGGRVTR